MDASSFNSLSVFGSILDAIGSVYSGFQNNSVAKYNAKISEAQARLVEGNIALRNYRSKKEIRQFAGVQAAGYAASGVKLTGSPIDVMVESQSNMELETMLGNINDQVTAAGYRTQSQLYKAQGLSSLSQGFMGGAKSLLSAVANYKSPSKTQLGSDTIGGTSGNSNNNQFNITSFYPGRS